MGSNAGTVADRIITLVRARPGLTEIMIAEHLFGHGARQQRVNQDCRLLVAAGALERRGGGGPGDPYRYHPPRAARVPAAPSDIPDLWPFSLAVYAGPDVAAACLLAQDEHGADVNLLLWAAWLGARGHVLTPVELSAARHATAPWRQDVVQPLRALRRRLKSGPAPAPEDAATQALRAQVKAAELEAERIQQTVLARLPLHRRTDAGWDEALAANLSLLLPGDAATAVTEPLHSAIRGL
ncbi:TIGR02444 family protein [Niveispirillum fermenti]|uniref:TIGR02444 family protein n=1 Tax=Niveispirillum fermenti TaxID=1233113 RepID=UPI003A870682